MLHAKSPAGNYLDVACTPLGSLNIAQPVTYKVVTSDATGLNVASGPAVLYGEIMIAAGTMANVHDALTVTGDVIIPSTTVSVTFGGLGIICPIGITCDWTSGTWLVLYSALG